MDLNGVRVRQCKGEVKPALARFVGCAPADGAELEDVGGSNGVRLDEGEADGSKQLFISAGDQSYQGRFVPHDGDTRPVRYLVGALDAKSKVFYVSEVQGEFLLRPRRAPRDADAADAAHKDDTGAESKRLLVQQFGAARNRRQLKSAIENAVTDDKISAAEAGALKSTIKRRASEATPEKALTAVDLRIPPHDAEATELDQAYPLWGLITAAEYGDIETVADRVAELLASDQVEALRTEIGLVETVLEQCRAIVPSTAGSEPGPTEKARICAAVYLNYLIRFNREVNVLPKGKATVTIRKATLAPLSVATRLAKDFLGPDSVSKDGSKLSRSPRLRDDALNYALVLWLTAVNFAGEFEPIAAALQLTPKRCMLYLTYLGCSFKSSKKVDRGTRGADSSSGTKKYIARLNVPLKIPDQVKSKRGRR